MKKILLILFLFSFTSCGTILGGKVTEYQRTKPNKAKGEPSRAIRPWALIGDIVTFPIIAVAVDFVTCGIYKPEPPKKTADKN